MLDKVTICKQHNLIMVVDIIHHSLNNLIMVSTSCSNFVSQLRALPRFPFFLPSIKFFMFQDYNTIFLFLFYFYSRPDYDICVSLQTKHSMWSSQIFPFAYLRPREESPKHRRQHQPLSPIKNLHQQFPVRKSTTKKGLL